MIKCNLRLTAESIANIYGILNVEESYIDQLLYATKVFLKKQVQNRWKIS